MQYHDVNKKSYKTLVLTDKLSNCCQGFVMALSKNAYERIGQIQHTDFNINIEPSKILEVCKISYRGSISVEIINHLLGGQIWITMSLNWKIPLTVIIIAARTCLTISRKGKENCCSSKTAIIQPRMS